MISKRTRARGESRLVRIKAKTSTLFGGAVAVAMVLLAGGPALSDPTDIVAGIAGWQPYAEPLRLSVEGDRFMQSAHPEGGRRAHGLALSQRVTIGYARNWGGIGITPSVFALRERNPAAANGGQEKLGVNVDLDWNSAIHDFSDMYGVGSNWELFWDFRISTDWESERNKRLGGLRVGRSVDTTFSTSTELSLPMRIGMHIGASHHRRFELVPRVSFTFEGDEFLVDDQREWRGGGDATFRFLLPRGLVTHSLMLSAGAGLAAPSNNYAASFAYGAEIPGSSIPANFGRLFMIGERDTITFQLLLEQKKEPRDLAADTPETTTRSWGPSLKYERKF